jgi:glycosyltransferase involved in cell wall biosynthesis
LGNRISQRGKPKVLHLLTSLGAGGAETNLLALCRHFDRSKFHHAVAFGGGGALEEEFVGQGVELVPLSVRPLCLRSVFELSKMVARVSAFAPTIVHSHLDLPNVVGLVARRRLGCKLVLHFHNVGIIPRSELPGRSRIHLLWNGIARFYRQCDRAIAICTYELPYLRRVGIPDDRIVLIPNGLTLDDSPESSPSQDKRFSFACVARFFPAKDHGVLVDAFAKVVSAHPEATLALVGDGPLRGAIEERVRRRGLEKNVLFLGLRRDVATVLSMSRAFVLASCYELSPITILEAMNAGLPVVASDVGGVSDTVVDGETGLLVRPRSVDALAEALLRLVNEPDLANEMGWKGRARLVRRFSNADLAKRIESVYEVLLDRGHRQ